MHVAPGRRRFHIAAVAAVVAVACLSCSRAPRPPERPLPGGVLGRSAGIQFISLQNGDCTTLIPQEARQEGESWPTLGWGRFGAPAYDPGTSTLYYVDHKQGAVLRWRSGDREPSVLCQIAHKYHPLHTIWLLLKPSGTELYFGWAEDISDRTKLVECSVATGRTRTIAHDIDCQARPACLDDHHLLVVHYDPRRDGVAQPAVKKLDTRNGRMTSLLSGQPKLHSFSLSPSQRRILVVSDGRFRLHEFPTFRLLKDIPDGALGHQDDWGDWTRRFPSQRLDILELLPFPPGWCQVLGSGDLRYGP